MRWEGCPVPGPSHRFQVVSTLEDMRFCALAVLLVVPLVAQQPPEEDLKNPFAGKPDAVEAGRTLYVQSCSACNGPNAEGGRGPRLADNGSIRGASNRRLFESIKNGVRGSDMPPSNLPEEMIWQMVSFVKAVNAAAYESNVPGDVAAGGKIFQNTGGCANCHAIGGKGGVIGPDLTNIGVKTVAAIREAVLKPSERLTEGFQGVTVTLKSGRKIEGVAKDYTNYSIAVMETSGKLHLLNKLDVSEVVFHDGSLMPPDFGQRLSKQDFENLLAFLSKQAARPPLPRERKGR